MFARDLLSVAGVVWLVAAVIVYNWTGTFSLKKEVAGAGGTAGAVIFIIIGLACLAFAWRNHLETVKALAMSQKQDIGSDQRDTNAWLNR